VIPGPKERGKEAHIWKKQRKVPSLRLTEQSLFWQRKRKSGGENVEPSLRKRDPPEKEEGSPGILQKEYSVNKKCRESA